ncbi:MAG: tRNA lysidine(34) synthetase TilS [Deltaproteobacteria bacterium]|nr:tRNA lysidine(34) synthetase TilS [Deltaproteobacteria bacterium]
MDFIAAVKRQLARHAMAPRGARILAAVSGGPDSMAMLLALCSLRRAMGFELGAAYVDHGLRRRAKAELAFVKREARRFGIAFHAALVDVKGAARRERSSVEAAARRLRYEALASIARAHGYDRIATAHTANDQAETVLMHVIAGTGLDGLAGILPVRRLGCHGQTRLPVRDGHGQGRFASLSVAPSPPCPVGDSNSLGLQPPASSLQPVLIVRPLLSVTRRDVEEFLRAKKIPSVTDETNLDPKFERNKVRRTLIPLVEKEFNPAVVSALARLAENARQDAEAIESTVAKAFEHAVTQKPDRAMVNRKRLNSLPPAARARVLDRTLRHLAPRARFDRIHIDSLAERIACGTGTKHLHLPGRIVAKVDYESATIARDFPCGSLTPHASRLMPPVVVPGSGVYDVPWADVTFRFGRQGRGALYSARIDRALADYPFVIRAFRPGDRIAPPFSRHVRKLKKIFIDQKIPRDERARLPLLCSADTVLWIPGVTEAPGSKAKAALRVAVTKLAAKGV